MIALYMAPDQLRGYRSVTAVLRKKKEEGLCYLYVAKTKALINCAVTPCSYSAPLFSQPCS